MTAIRFGYEEALGYAVAPHVVRDKDGISAALIFAELAAELKATGRTVLDRLDELARTFGVHATDQLSVRVVDRSQTADMMARLRAATPNTLAGRKVIERRDLLTDPGDFPASRPGVAAVGRRQGGRAPQRYGTQAEGLPRSRPTSARKTSQRLARRRNGSLAAN